jgi:hypothetical protein
MIAEVSTANTPPGQITDETRKWVEEGLAEARTHDGVEGIISAWDPATGESVNIALFRDQAARDAYQAHADEMIAEAKTRGSEVAAGRTYSEVIAVL